MIAMIFLLATGLAIGLFASALDSPHIISFIGGFIFMLGIAVPIIDAEQEAKFRDGQIACMEGDIQYEQVVEQDTTYRPINE